MRSCRFSVVRDHEQGAAGVLEVLLQELDGVDVQVVRGLVHDVEIGLGGQHLRERHPLDFAAGEVLHRLFPVREGELRQEPLHPALVLPQMVLVQVLRPFGGPVHDLPEDALLGVVGILLLQEGDADVLEEQDLATTVGLVLAGEDPQQGGLPGAVRRDAPWGRTTWKCSRSAGNLPWEDKDTHFPQKMRPPFGPASRCLRRVSTPTFSTC